MVIWDAATGRDLLSLYGCPGEVRGVAFRLDGQALASVGERMIRVWNAPLRDSTGEPGQLILRGHTGRVDAVAFSADSRIIATASWDRTVRLWNPATGQLIRTLHGPDGALSCIAIAPDGRVAVSGRDKTVTIWDSTGHLIQASADHQRTVTALAFSHDGRRLASGGEDGSVIVRDATTSRAMNISHITKAFVYALGFSPDDTQLAIAFGAGFVSLHDLRTGRKDRGLGSPGRLRVNALAYSPDGQSLASGTQHEGVQVWNPRTGDRIREIEDHEGEVLSVAYSPDGRYLASGGTDRTLRIRDARDGTALHVFADGAGPIRGLTFSPDGRYLAATNGDNTVRVWDLVRSPWHDPDKGKR